MASGDSETPQGTQPTGRLVLIAGRDPREHSGGSESYAVASGRAALLAGYDPQVLIASDRDEVRETDFGTLHRIRVPLPLERSIYSRLHRPWIVRASSRLLSEAPGPHVVHALGLAWADTAVAVAQRVKAEGHHASAVATAFTTVLHENISKLEDDALEPLSLPWLRYRWELLFARQVSARLEGRALRNADAVVVNYDSVRGIVEDNYGRLRQIRRLPYCAPAAFSETASGRVPSVAPGQRRAPLILSVSRHDGRKGLDVLLRALALLRSRGRSFTACLVGTGPLLDAHVRLADSLGLGSLVTLPGRVPDVISQLANCQIFVLPSREEGSGSVSVLEALQVGAPIVASAVDGLIEDLTHARTALLVPPGDPRALADALDRLLGNSALRRALGQAGRALYEQRFTPEPWAAALVELYTDLGLAPSRASSIASAT